jgi:hypothetical protein
MLKPEAVPASAFSYGLQQVLNFPQKSLKDLLKNGAKTLDFFAGCGKL